jgi:hypothetical protein
MAALADNPDQVTIQLQGAAVALSYGMPYIQAVRALRKEEMLHTCKAGRAVCRRPMRSFRLGRGCMLLKGSCHL